MMNTGCSSSNAWGDTPEISVRKGKSVHPCVFGGGGGWYFQEGTVSEKCYVGQLPLQFTVLEADLIFSESIRLEL